MEQFFGLDKIGDYGLYLRGSLITLYAIVLFRMNLSRVYGNHSPLDFIIYIILGAIFGEAIVNNIPLLPSIIVCTLIAIIYRTLIYLTYKSRRVGKYIKGEPIDIIKDGKYIEKNLRLTRLTHHDIEQALRLAQVETQVQSVKNGILERDGQISFQMKRSKTKGTNGAD